MDDTLTPVDRYLSIIHAYDNEFKRWVARAEKILKRYRDDDRTQSDNQTAKFNILWSNVQTLVPAVYAKMPKADVSRRFSDNDPVGRVASLLIERDLDYEIEHYPDFRAAMRHAVEDRFLPGRGTAWVRYEPHIAAQDLEVTDDVESDDDNAPAPPQEIKYECSPADYVHWRDFGHTVARTWEEVGQVWRIVYLDKAGVTDRFGEEIAKTIAFDSSPKPLNNTPKTAAPNDKAQIYELWDKESKTVYWLVDGQKEFLDQKPDPLGLEGFFPCPRPLYATTTSDSLVPVPDFALYQDQARELDILSDRIDGLIRALRVRGVYNASVPSLQRLLTEGDNNTLIPVEQWNVFSEKGGLAGAVDILDIAPIAAALIQAYQAHEEVKGQIYEITGLSDILRGESVATETATAQQIKSQYAGLRLRSMQETVALFATGLLQRMAQIICTKYQPETILQYAAAHQMSQEDQQLIPQALQLIQKDPLRSFRVEVAADSLIQLDEDQNKADRVEFLKAFSMFLGEAVPAGQSTPELAPMLMEVMKFGVSGFKVARQIEGTIDVALQQLTAKAAQVAKQGPAPDPETMKVHAQQQTEQAKIQAQAQQKASELQANTQIEQIKAQAAQHEAIMDDQFKKQELAMNDQFERWKVDQETARAIMVARISANPGADIPILETEQAASQKITDELGAHFDRASEQVAKAHQGVAEMHDNIQTMHAQLMQQLAAHAAAASAPKRVVRGPDGRVSGIETVPPGATMQ